MKIFINPGHEPTLDPGACGNGLREADVALKIGKRVENYLRAVGYEVKLFQYDGLHEICADANSWCADLFVSIHCNAAENLSAKGTETFFSYGSAGGRSLAEKIQKQIVNSVPVVDRGVKQANFAVLTGTNMPAVLVETAFISNADDAELLVDCEDDFARAIARGITDFFLTETPLPDVADVPKKSAGQLSEHFHASEFVCPCCGTGNIKPRLIELLEQLRAKVGNFPIHVNSGYRCPKHNAEVGGVANSQHVFGNAADITIPLAGYYRTRKAVEELDFDGTGFYPPLQPNTAWFIHVDVREGGTGAHIEWEE
ncbi:MAG: N-acetylmuramoyl-L-alanine amidase [Selenomonadaceae bacterium]|nr:N-acetylmuramoyl-L-alanine amidase [Selenomonadaceae bacterium]MBR1805878.1 N-acetylmuramoyl-L-alanine amidase [Selenomonadaceae bacterium]